MAKNGKGSNGNGGKGKKGGGMTFLQGKGAPYYAKPLTRKQARKELKAAIKLKYGPERAVIKSQAKGLKLQGQRTADYFKEHNKLYTGTKKPGDAPGLVGASRIAGQQSVDAINQAAQDTSTYADALRKRMEQEARDDAAKRGVAYDASAAGVASDADVNRRTAADVLAGVVAAQAQGQTNYLTNRRDITKREGIEAQLRLQAQRRALGADKRALAKEQGAFAVDFARTERGDERDYFLALQELLESKRQRRFNRRQALHERKFQNRNREDEQAHTSAENAADRAADKAADKADKKADKKDDRKEKRAEVQEATAILRSGGAADKLRSGKLTPAQVVDALVADKGISRPAAKKAVKKILGKSAPEHPGPGF